MQAEQALLALVRGSRRGRQEGEDGVLSLPRLCSAPAVSSAGNLEIAKFKNEKRNCCHEQEGAWIMPARSLCRWVLGKWPGKHAREAGLESAVPAGRHDHCFNIPMGVVGYEQVQTAGE